MAYASVVSLVQTLEHILEGHEILYNQDQFECLLVKVTFLRDFLEEFSTKCSKEVKDVEGQIGYLAYAAQDIIDSYASNQLVSMCECCIDRDFSIFSQELGKLIGMVDSTISNVSKLRDVDSKNLEPKNSLAAGFSILASGVKNSMVGFIDEMVQIKEWLTGPPSYKLCVLPIVGMGGSGKTTLARNIYEDKLIEYHFYTCAWVTVSQEYHVREILLGLLESMKMLTAKNYDDSIDQLDEYLYKSLKGSRYLIVLDDLWDVDLWEHVKRLFPDDGNGSRIMVTSRISDVALYVCSNNPPYYMRFLRNDESWNLLKRKVFEDECCPPELEKVGSEIAESCQGLPLAILLVGGMLAKVQCSQDQWRNAAENMKSVIAIENDRCLEILSLSYNHLPHHLKMCFLYMGVFPEDYQIPVSKLIWLWAAEGFLKPHSDISLVDLGEKYLKDLIDRSIVLVGKRTSSGKIKTCSFHDLVRDLCMKEARKENFLRTMRCDDDLSSEDAYGHRRLSFDSSILHDDASYCRDSIISVHENSDGHLKEIYDAIRSSPLIHSLIFTGTYYKLMNIYLGFRLLRVLDAFDLTFLWFPMDVLQLVNLRYLAFTLDGELPASISNLQYLSFFIVNQNLFGPLSYLSSEIWGMQQLRFLKFKEMLFPDYPATLFYGRNIFCLENLQTLTGIRDFRVTKDVFKCMPNLKKLGIIYDRNSNTEEWSYYCLHNLVYLHQLETLNCHFRSTRKHISSKKQGLPGLTFPSSLKKLTLSGWEIPSEYMETIGSLQNLEILKLQLCSLQDPEWDLLEGQYGRLKVLLVEKMNLVRWRAESDHFPILERLIINRCDKLEEVPSSFGEIPTLQLIKLLHCSSSCKDSVKQILEDQQSFGNDGLKVITESITE